MPSRTLGERIRYYRTEKGLTIPELAEAADIPAPRLRELESGKKQATVRETAKLAIVFEITLNKLTTGLKSPDDHVN